MTTQELVCENCGAANSASAYFCQQCAAPLMNRSVTGKLAENTLLNGRYQLEACIGKGGMGAVYRAIDTRFNNRTLALKEMSRANVSAARQQEAEEAFERESQLLAELLHPNLPRIYDNFAENERSYLVMDFIEGETLEDYIQKNENKPLPLERVLPWSLQICDVLNYLHTHQPPIIFRDLKPGNVMVSPRGHVYLIDFGIARFFKPGQSHDTIALGSPGYAAPEQYGKAQSSPRSDLYSLGALLHCLLTGADPSDQPFFFRPASELNPAIPIELEEYLQRLLQMDPAGRPDNAEDVAKALRDIDQKRINGTLKLKNNRISGSISSQTSPHPTITSVRERPDIQYLLQEAYDHYANRRVQDAIRVYDQALKMDNTNPLAWQGRGLTLALTGQHQNALAAFERALQLDPNLVISLNGKGTALNILHRNQDALEVFDRAVLLEPDNAVAWNGKGAVLSALNQTEQALTAFDIALHFDQNMAQAWGNKGLVLRQVKKLRDAQKAFEQAIFYDKKSSFYWNGKGLVLFDMGKYQEAAQAFQEALKIDSKYAPSWYGLGNVFYGQQQYKRALESYDRALQIDRRFVKAWEKRGAVLTDMGHFNKALESYNEALRLDSRYASAWTGKGSVLCQLEEYHQALDAYNRALLINPNAAQAWNGKGNAFYHLDNYEMALDAYERALGINSKMVSALHNKALVLKHMRRYSESLAAAETAIRIAPHDPDNWLRKAEALRKLHRRGEAKLAESEVERLRTIR